MATPAQTAHHTTRIEGPARKEIRAVAEEIRQNWTAAESKRRRAQARTAQQRLFCLAFSVAA